MQPLKNPKDIIILGIESSCDDTSAAVICNDKILANITAGQEVHASYGGVVPELASRAHQKHIVPVVHEALKKAGIGLAQLHAIAYTKGPGLLGSLLVGSSFAKSMAQGLGIPALPIHHMRAHILALFIDRGQAKPTFPFLCLTVSGGHTQIVKLENPQSFEILGQTLDDAAGEAFDKAAKVMGLPYPGGPLIDKYARTGNPLAFRFTKPKVNGLDFSFSGLKTNFRNFVEKQKRLNANFIDENLHDLCASIQHTIVEMLLENLGAAASRTGISEIGIAGGVSANSYLKTKLTDMAEARNWNIHLPPMEYCTDNAAMIAMAGFFEHEHGAVSSLGDAAKARWDI